MKKVSLLIFLLLFSLKIVATECVGRIFQDEYLNLYLCQNHSNYNETRALLFETRAKILNTYISERIKSGQLKNKKFEIQLHDEFLTFGHLFISQNKNCYFVSCSGFPTIHQLKSFVDYFAKNDWKPIFISNNQIKDSEVSKQISNFYKNNLSTDALGMEQLLVWNKDNLNLYYINDTLKYFVNSIQLDIKSTSSLPVRIQDRFLLFQEDAIFVLQGQEIITSISTTYKSEDYDNYIYNKWVNICIGGVDNWIYSYSYDKNHFYKRKN